MGLNLKPIERTVFLGCLLAALCVAWHFHNKFWWGPDEGFYAYISQRMLAGDVVHKDIQALHPGLLYFVNTFFLKLSGGDPVGLRYPLVMITVVQTALAFLLCRKYGLLIAASACAAMIGFSFIQFINPTPNWYLVTLTLGIAYLLETRNTKSAKTLAMIGALVGIGFLMRQLTGTFLAMGVTAILFLKHSENSGTEKYHTGSIILLMLAFCLSFFIFSSANVIGFFLFGLFPPIILFLAAAKSNLSWKTAFPIISNLMLGAVLVALPLAIYHVLTGSFSIFLYDSLIAPFGFHELTHVNKASYASLIYFPVKSVLTGDLAAFGGLLFWSSLLLINSVLAIIVVKTLLKNTSQIPALGVVVLFHSLVALIYEIPIYLTYTTGLILVALLASNISFGKRHGLPIAVIAFSLIGTYFHAAHPLSRSVEDIALNHKIQWSQTPLVGSKIVTDADTVKYYNDIVDLVEACTTSSDKIFAFPVNPEIYFLSKRQSAFVFINSAYGLASDEQVDKASNQIRFTDQPAIILHKQSDKYNTKYSDSLLAKSLSDYHEVGVLHDLTIYHRTGHSLASSCKIGGS